MSKVISITDKLDPSRPQIEINGKNYEVDDSLYAVLKFEELQRGATSQTMVEAFEIALGKEACEELNVQKWSVPNFKVLTTAVLAAMQGMEYDEAEARFQAAEASSN